MERRLYESVFKQEIILFDSKFKSPHFFILLILKSITEVNLFEIKFC